MTEQTMICKMLDTIEAVIDNNPDAISKEELEEYVTTAIHAHKKYGRRCDMVHTVVDMLEGLGIGTLNDAGLTYEDYRAAYNFK